MTLVIKQIHLFRQRIPKVKSLNSFCKKAASHSHDHFFYVLTGVK